VRRWVSRCASLTSTRARSASLLVDLRVAPPPVPHLSGPDCGAAPLVCGAKRRAGTSTRWLERSSATRRLLRQVDALAARHLTHADWPDQIEAVRLQQQLERADVLGRQLRLLEVAWCEAVDAKDGSRDGQRHPAHYQINETRPNQKVPEPAAWTPSRTPAPCGRLPAVDLLTELDAFFTDHHHCGDLDAGAASGFMSNASRRRRVCR
jgi:hypothetical protein